MRSPHAASDYALTPSCAVFVTSLFRHYIARGHRHLRDVTFAALEMHAFKRLRGPFTSPNWTEVAGHLLRN